MRCIRCDIFFFKHKTAYEMRISDGSSDVCSSDLRQRAAAEVAAEMAYLKQRFGPDHVWMADDIFGFRVDWLAEFARHLEALDARVPFTIQIRANRSEQRRVGKE